MGQTQTQAPSWGTCMQVATQVVGSLLALEAMDENEPIRLYVNSTGQLLRAAMYAGLMHQWQVASLSTAQLIPMMVGWCRWPAVLHLRSA